VAPGGVELQGVTLVRSAHFQAQRVDQKDHELIGAASRVTTWTALRQAREKPNQSAMPLPRQRQRTPG